MDFIEASIFILLIAVVSVPFATRFRLPLEISLVIGSCMISLIPGLPSFQINPMIVFYLFLPPILFYAAYFTSWRDLKFNFRPIFLLAFGLVIFTTFAVAAFASALIPGITWQEGFLLGAIISPTDASAATAIIRKLKAPRRLITILEGESLVNDATALLLFRFGLAALVSGSFSMSVAVSRFFIVTLGGAAVGFGVGLIGVFLLKRLDDAKAETVLTFLTAFTCYLIGEHLGVSGVIATVVCGIYFGIRFPEYSSSQTRINAKASWNTLMFIVNGFVFALIGLALPSVLQNLAPYSLSEMLFYGIAISLMVILLRLIWIIPGAYLTRFIFPVIARKDPVPPPSALFILSWSGMRGIVSLAAVLSLPFNLAPNIPFQHRDLLIFITYCVIVVTLFLPAFSLPFLLQYFRLTDNDNKMKEEAIARVRSLEEVLTEVEKVCQAEHISVDLFKEFRLQIERKLRVIKTQLEETPYSTLSNDYSAVKRLTIAAIEAEREALTKLRKTGEIHDDVFHLLSQELDLEELRVKSLRI